MDSHARSLAKALSYRLLGSISTAGLFYLFTGNAKLSIGIGALDSVFKLLLYFFHERLWNYVHLGRQRAPEYEI